VRIVVPPIGGAYGAKTHARLEPIVAWLARLARRPVQLVLTREEVFATAVRHASVVRIRTGVRRDGTLVAREVESIYDTGAYAHTGPMTTKSGGVVSTGPYRIGHQRIRSHCVYTNKPPAGPYRGFGVSQVCWAYEQQMDEIADALGIDPLEIRRRNLIADGDTFVTGQPFVSVGIAECLDGVATAVDWGTPSETVDPDVVRGKGLAVSIKTTMTPSNSAASVRLNADGSAVLLISSAEMGQGVQTSMGQIVGEVLGIDPERVIVSLPDTDVTPFDSSTSSSRTIFSMGNAARLAAAEIRDELLGLAVDLLEAAVDDIELRDGRAFVHGAQAQAVPYSALFKKKFGMPVGSLFGSFDYQTVGGLDHATGKGRATSFFFLGACAAEVEVDVPTGRVTVLRIATSADVGKAITPVQCHLQNEGSMIMALGTALFEEMVFDNGQPINSTFLDYTIPSLEDHPREFRSLLVEHPHPDGPFGAKGAGEAVMPAIAPAIANAVSQALGGVRVNAMPLMPHVVRAAIEAHQQDRG
jgi:CO/xanthine dehydrogenase Mo-binding subunit